MILFNIIAALLMTFLTTYSGLPYLHIIIWFKLLYSYIFQSDQNFGFNRHCCIYLVNGDASISAASVTS